MGLIGISLYMLSVSQCQFLRLLVPMANYYTLPARMHANCNTIDNYLDTFM